MLTGQTEPRINGNGFVPSQNALDRTAPRRFYVPSNKGMANILLPNIPHERPTALNGEIARLQQTTPTFMNGYLNGESKFSNGIPPMYQGVGISGYVSQPFYGTTVMVADVRDVMTQLEQSWESARGNGTGYADPALQLAPDLAESRLIGITVDHCSVNPVACQGFDIPGIARDLAGKYAAWFNRTFPKGWGDAYNYDAATFAAKFPGANRAAEWMYPEGGTATTPVVMPTPTYTAPVQQTPAPQTMTQQLQTMGGSGSNTVSNQNTSTTPPPGNTGTNDDITKLLKDNWVILALAAGALVLLPQMMGGNRS